MWDEGVTLLCCLLLSMWDRILPSVMTLAPFVCRCYKARSHSALLTASLLHLRSLPLKTPHARFVQNGPHPFFCSFLLVQPCLMACMLALVAPFATAAPLLDTVPTSPRLELGNVAKSAQKLRGSDIFEVKDPHTGAIGRFSRYGKPLTSEQFWRGVKWGKEVKSPQVSSFSKLKLPNSSRPSDKLKRYVDPE